MEQKLLIREVVINITIILNWLISKIFTRFSVFDNYEIERRYNTTIPKGFKGIVSPSAGDRLISTIVK